MEEVRQEFETASHANKVKFETEFNIYKEIWVKLIPFQEAALDLRPKLEFSEPESEVSKDEARRLKMKALYDAWDPFRIVAENNRPFYPSDVREDLRSLLRLGGDEMRAYRNGEGKDHNKYWNEADANRKKIEELVERICETIRNRPGFIAARVTKETAV